MQYLFNIFRFTKILWPYYVAVMASAITISLLSLAIPFIIKYATDLVVDASSTGADHTTSLLWLAVLLFVADYSTSILFNVGGYLGDMMSQKMRSILSKAYYRKLLSLSQEYFDNELSGKIINRLDRTITEVTNFINAFANNFGSMLLTVVFVLIILFVYSWELALMLLVLYPLFMWLTALTSKKWQKYMAKRNEQMDIASGRFAEVIGQIKVVKSFLQESRELSFFRRRFNRNVALTSQQSMYWHKMDMLRRTVLNVIVCLMYGFVFYYTMHGRFTIGDMVLIIQLIALARQPIFGMSFMVEQAQKAIAGSKDYFDIMSLEPIVQDKPGARQLTVTKGSIEYRSVSFGYSAGQSVLEDVSFAINPDEKIALVGESGEGKTTLTNLLMRLYEPRAGEILIDGQAIADVTQQSLRETISVVFQEPALFSGTIKENISYAKPGATEQDIISAAKRANAYEFIKKLPRGFDAEIGERGLKLSGGQKQRIAIARALLKDAPILVLDEATSSLDSRSERMVQEALNVLMKGRTTLIIAHRLSTIAHVDRIITLKQGTVDEVGAPGELAKTGGIYAQLLALQMESQDKAKKSLAKFDIAE